MPVAAVVFVGFAVFALAFRVYGRLAARALGVDVARRTPAVERSDGVDFVPTPRAVLLAQHFAAIAAAGPIVGPIAAAAGFGWLPALLWIVLGNALLGAVHDLSSLVASVRHRACSITEVAKEHLGRRAYAPFLVFIWASLVYVVIAFTDLTGRQFVEKGLGGGVAVSSAVYIGLAVALGAWLRAGRSLAAATVVALPLLFLVIWGGQELPVSWRGALEAVPVKAYDAAILAYCFVASVLPLGWLLQPRGYLGGYFLYATLIGGLAGLLLGSGEATYPAFLGWTNAQGDTLFPFLFVTIACGACSGFHGLVCSGTTSKQLSSERDARAVGYGGMLLEGVVALLALATVMVLAGPETAGRDPTRIYAEGLARFVGVFGVPERFGTAFGMLAFATFVYDTLDVATRLGRYLLEEAFGLRGVAGRTLATLATLGIPLAYILLTPDTLTIDGRSLPPWRAVWTVFGASNQLLAALTLLVVSVWLHRTRRATWISLLPALFMFVTTVTALAFLVVPLVEGGPTLSRANALVSAALLALAAWIAYCGLVRLRGAREGTESAVAAGGPSFRAPRGGVRG
jgi:carbon starvation protein